MKNRNNEKQELFLTNNFPNVKIVIVNDKKKEKINNIDDNELLMKFHCEV